MRFIRIKISVKFKHFRNSPETLPKFSGGISDALEETIWKSAVAAGGVGGGSICTSNNIHKHEIPNLPWWGRGGISMLYKEGMATPPLPTLEFTSNVEERAKLFRITLSNHAYLHISCTHTYHTQPYWQDRSTSRDTFKQNNDLCF